MRISKAFPSDYLKASDLDGRNVKVVMSHVTMEEIGGDHKPVLRFQGKDKGMVLNKTNSNNIVAAYGEETEDWNGKEIILYEAMVDFQGKTVPAIRVRAPTAKDQPKRRLGGVSDMAIEQQENSGPDMDDEIPF